MSLSTKVKLYCSANGISSVDFRNDVRIVDLSDGNGAKIVEWNIDSLAQPTDDQLNSYNSAAITEEKNNVIRNTRKNSYGNIGDQLDEIYKDIDAWKARIKSIKDANPKE